MALLVLGYFFPEKGITISDNLKLKFPSLQKLLSPDKPDYVALPNLVFIADSTSTLLLKEEESKEIMEKDTAINKAGEATKKLKNENKAPETPKEVPLKKYAEYEQKSIKIIFSEKNKKRFNSFFEKLELLKNENREKIRIVHYGDSQIESDRISGFIRERLQAQFGGKGPGLLSAYKFYNQASVKQSNTGNWYRYTLYGKVDETVPHFKYGAMYVLSRFTPFENTDITSVTTDIDKMPITASAYFDVQKSLYPSSRKFDEIRMFYGAVKKPTNLKIVIPENDTLFFTLQSDKTFNELKVDLKSYQDQVTLQLEGEESPDIYGISLESQQGIHVDNIAMRGSSGTIFTKSDKDELKAMLKSISTELLILQFGGNVMPYMKDSADCENYGNWFYAQLAMFKKILPEIDILVIGPADMSVKKEDFFETYPLLECVNETLKNAAFKADAGFWNMYAAMGGKNSMPTWVAADPPLAAKDYIHFSPKGARIIAELLYEAFRLEYENYQAGILKIKTQNLPVQSVAK